MTGISLSIGNHDSTFIVSRLSPHVDTADRKEFENNFNFQILFFSEVKQNERPDSTGRSKGFSAHIRDDLTSKSCFFQAIHIISMIFIIRDVTNVNNGATGRRNGLISKSGAHSMHWSIPQTFVRKVPGDVLIAVKSVTTRSPNHMVNLRSTFSGLNRSK
ncbi:hypothetical protein ACOME3_002402 [Neoechinorhynchus agilis]